MIVTVGGGGGMAGAFTRRGDGTLDLRFELRRQPFHDASIAGAAARRIVAEAGGEIGDADAARGVDPEPRAQAVSVAGMADQRPRVAERVVARRTLGEDLHGEAVAAVEILLGVAVGTVEPPGEPAHLGEAGFGEEAAAVGKAAVAKQHLPDPGEGADRDSKPALRREQGAVRGERRRPPGA